MKIQLIRKKGSVLAYMLVIMTVVVIIFTSSIKFIVSRIKYGYYTASREEAFQISESGINYFRWYLAHNTDGRTAQQIKTFWQTRALLPAESEDGAEYKDPSGAAIGRFKLEVTPPETGSTITTVKSTGWTYKNPDAVRIVQARLRRPSWSEYIALADDFMRFGEGTETYGKIKSNKGIRFDGLAHNLVLSSVYTFDDPDHSGSNEYGVHTHVNPPPGTGVNNTFRSSEAPPNSLATRSDVFLAGRQIQVTTTDFTGISGDLSTIKAAAINHENGSLYFDNSSQGRHIILKDNGTFDIQTVKNFYPQSYEIHQTQGGWANYPIPNDGVIFVENNIWLEGKISDKRVTIVSANMTSATDYNVFISKDITYTHYDGSDILGIISQNDVKVTQNSENNLRIDAAMIAQEGNVGRDWYSYWDHKDTITIYGAIATKLRYGFAYTDGSGYTNRYLNFDNNLLYYPPPYFPTGTQYLLDLWKEL